MFLNQKYGGITKYFCELIKNLPKEHQYKLSVLFSENQHLKDDQKYFNKIHIPITSMRDFKGKWRINSGAYKINKFYSEYTISLGNYDLLHPTFFDPYFLKNLKKPYVITVHDLIEFKFKDQYKNNSKIPEMEKIIKNANRIISISENTKKDLIDIMNINPDKIDVIYHGFNRPIFKSKSNSYGRYILFVGYRGGYKNFLTLAKVFSNLIKRDDNLRLICVGQPFLKEEIEELINLNILEKTLVLGVNENELNELYSNALAFVYPTLYEGFGMSILEAFANNCPVCLSNSSSLPEVAGNAGVYFDPTDPESITNAIEKVIYDEEFSKKLKNAGNLQLNHFSWKKCALETTTAYNRAI